MSKLKKVIKKVYRAIMPWGDVSKKIYASYWKMRKAYKKGNRFLANFYSYRIEKKYRCLISPGAEIGCDLLLPHPNGVVIGGGSQIGKNVTVYQQVTIGKNHGKYPVIGNGVIIYAGAKIVGGVRIGDNSIIGANAVVVCDVPDNSIWGGVPAKKIKDRDEKGAYS